MKFRKSDIHLRAGQKPINVQCAISGGRYGPHAPAPADSTRYTPSKRLSLPAAWQKGLDEGAAIADERRKRGPLYSPSIPNAFMGAHKDDPCYTDLTPEQASGLEWEAAHRRKNGLQALLTSLYRREPNK